MSVWGLHYQKSDRSYHSYEEYDNNMRRLPESGHKVSTWYLIMMQKKAEQERLVELSRVCPKCHCIKSPAGECLCY